MSVRCDESDTSACSGATDPEQTKCLSLKIFAFSSSFRNALLFRDEILIEPDVESVCILLKKWLEIEYG